MIRNIRKILLSVIFFIVYTNCSLLCSMKILFVVDNKFDYAHSFFIDQAVELYNRGHNVSIYIPDSVNGAWEYADYFKPIVTWKKYDKNLPPNMPIYDIIFCENGVLGKKMAQIKQVHNDITAKLVTYIIGPDITGNIETSNGLYNQLFKDGDLFLSTCHYVKTKMQVMGVASGKVRVLNPGVDCDLFKFRLRVTDPDKEIQLISVGNFDEINNMECVIRAFSQVVNAYPKSRLTLVGSGTLLPRIQELIKELGLRPFISLTGKLSRNDLINTLSRSHIFLYGSSTQRNGIQQGVADTVKQAMAIGLPIVAAHHGGILDLIQEGVTGMLVSENDCDKLACKIKNLIKFPTSWPKIALQARYKMVNSMNLQDTIDQLEKILLDLIGQGGNIL